MKLIATLSALGLAAAAVALTSSPADSQGSTAISGQFAITVTNMTRSQIFSPVLVASHQDAASIFTVGQPASPELALLAEDGDHSLLMASLAALPTVHDVQAGTGMIHPGMSETIFLNADLSNQFLSLAGMLVSTNDTFVGIDSGLLPLRSAELFVPAYDAGSEFNSEDCAFIPGPPCGSGGMHDPTPAEGFVHISNGMHGIGTVPQDSYDWRNPVAKVVIQRVM